MNFLSPDDIFTGVRRKSLCNGAILTLSNGKTSTPESANSVPNKAKKERRRGSFNESTGRRSSLVSRWFKHISDAAEQYKQRSKSSHEVVDDPASATLPHSNTKESLENTPERQTPSSATATATTAVGNASINNNISEREYTPIPEKGPNNFYDNNNALDISGAYGGGATDPSISRTDYHNESNNNEYGTPNIEDDIRVQQQLNSPNITGDEANSAAVTRRDNSSLYSNNSNNTRTLMQNSPLVEPSAIQISISPAHTAEPVLTPSERLKRLDNSIRENLVEKHKIICDMFRLPIEHFNEIVDIVAQPEAPKDSSDIALAAYAQVQSLTEVLNDYMKINSTEQEISAVSTVVCDQCHQTQQQHLQTQIQLTSNVVATTKRSVSPSLPNATLASAAIKTIPGETSNSTSAVHGPSLKTSESNIAALTASLSVNNDQIIHEDDDGYCEIDELRLPSVPISKSTVSTSSVGGIFKASLPIGVGVDVPSRNSSTPELLKRQSTISTDSIPEESEQEVTQLDEPTLSSSMSILKTTTSKDEEDPLMLQFNNRQNSSEVLIEQLQPENTNSSKIKQHNHPDDSLGSEHIEINDNYDTLNLSVIDNNDSTGVHHCQLPGPILCGPNRLLHANSLEPSVPCHLINGIVSTLNSQISLLLPKINERDQERERLRRENQHLRELLNAMHERQRVEANTETPAEITISAETSGETAIITATIADQSTIEQTN